MRVAVIGPTGPDTFADNILHCLPSIGAEGVAIGPATPRPHNRLLNAMVEVSRRQSAETEQWWQRPLISRIREARCDVVLNLHQSLMPGIAAKIKRLGPALALWYPDSVASTQRLAMVATDYDALFLKDALFVERLCEVYGMPAFYLPEACNPAWHRPVGEPASSPHIVVVGNLYATRIRLLTRLHDEGIPLKLYGSRFPRWYDPGTVSALPLGPFVTKLDKSRVFREAAGVLNNLHPAEMNSVNARLFEATAAGGAVLCERRGVLDDLYVDGKEVLAFSSFDELLFSIRSLLADPGRTEAIGDSGSARALKDHTYEVRLAAILAVLSR